MGASHEAVPAAGTLIDGKYEVVGVIAQGGMGTVVRATQWPLGREVALKLLRSGDDASQQRRLVKEAHALKAMTSEHAVRVLDFGTHDGAPYLVMELLVGTDLRAYVEDEGPLPVAEAVDHVLEAATAVSEAHELGIIHRDIKPANLFLARNRGRELVKVIDFGISRVPDSEPALERETREDAVLGTPHFMSPEQLRNPTRIDERADLWSLAVTLFYLLTGRLPFDVSSRRELVAAIFTDEPTSLHELRPEVSEALSARVHEAMAKRPEKRPPSVAAWARQLADEASPRGLRALELMAHAPAPRDSPSLVRDDHSTTEHSLSSTMAATDDEHADQKREPPTARAAWMVRASVGTLLAAGAIAALVVQRTRVAPTTTVPPSVDWAAPRASPSGPSRKPPPPEPPQAAPEATTSSSVAPPGPRPSRPHPSARRPASPPVAPPSRTSPSASSSAPAPAPPPEPRDIDGFPIIR